LTISMYWSASFGLNGGVGCFFSVVISLPLCVQREAKDKPLRGNRQPSGIILSNSLVFIQLSTESSRLSDICDPWSAFNCIASRMVSIVHSVVVR
jgi:hypothetical protein